MRSLIFIQFMLCVLSSAAMACQPSHREILAETSGRVKANFDKTQFVVIADILSIRNVKLVPSGSDLETEVERVTFRVERSFKGKLKPGVTFKIDSGIYLCSYGVRSGQWIPFVLGKSPRSREYPKRWLIYYTPPPAMSGPDRQLPPFEILSPLSRPVRWARYDIDVLKKFADQWKDGH